MSPDDRRPEPPAEDDPFAFAPDDRDRERAQARGNVGPGAPGTGDGRRPVAGPDPAGPAAAPDEPGQRGAAAEHDAGAVGDAGPGDPDAARAARAASTRWLVVGVLVLLALVVGSTLLAGSGGRDPAQVRPGERLPDFAAPIATRPALENDFVNLAQRDGQGEAGRRAACSIREPSAITSCALLRRGPLVLVVYSRGVEECLRAVDEVDAIRRALPRLSVLAVETRGTHDETAGIVRARRWRLPVAYDVDGALSTRLGAAVCPLVLFVRRDGAVAERSVGSIAPGELRTRAERLLRGPRTGTTTTARPPVGR